MLRTVIKWYQDIARISKPLIIFQYHCQYRNNSLNDSTQQVFRSYVDTISKALLLTIASFMIGVSQTLFFKSKARQGETRLQQVRKMVSCVCFKDFLPIPCTKETLCHAQWERSFFGFGFNNNNFTKEDPSQFTLVFQQDCNQRRRSDIHKIVYTFIS